MSCQFLPVQQSDSVIRMHVSTLFQISFSFRSPQSTKQNSHCYTVGSHQLSILYMKHKSESCSVVSDSLQHHGLYSPWNSPGQNTGVGSFPLLQGIFPTQGSNPGLPHCRQILYQLSHKGSPRILKWVAYPFSSGSFQPRNQTQVFYISGSFFMN